VRPDGTVKVLDFGLAKADAPGATVTLLESSSASERVAFSSTGTLAFVPEPDYKRRSLVWISPDGRMTDAGFGQRAFAAVALSLDGRRAAIRIVDDRDDALYTADPGGGALTLLAAPGAWIPAWSPDGKWIAGTVRQARADSSLTFSRVVTESGRSWEMLVGGFVEDNIVTQWTQDGRALLFSGRDRRPAADPSASSRSTVPPRDPHRHR